MINSEQFVLPINKSTLTYLFSVGLIGLSYWFIDTPYQHVLSDVGFFALSGAVTNWLAIYLLFEKVPLLYGSGVIPERFEDFKKGLRTLIIAEFFTKERVLSAITQALSENTSWESLAQTLDYDKIFNALCEAVVESSFGKVLSLVGGVDMLEPMRPRVTAKLAQVVKDTLADEDWQKRLTEKLAERQEYIYAAIENVIEGRLNQLTPQMVKRIIQDMIRLHLGWLVVWGGVFGGLIGLIASITKVM